MQLLIRFRALFWTFLRPKIVKTRTMLAKVKNIRS